MSPGSPRLRRRRWTACSPAIRMCAANRNRPCFTRRHWQLPRRPAPGTRAAFERAVECGNDAAARCLYAEWLMAQSQPDDREQARSLFASIIDDARHWSRHARSHNAAWLERTKVALMGY
ncbi:hypothetical protein SMG44B_10065 [Stenotrophomonas maltophilia]